MNCAIAQKKKKVWEEEEEEEGRPGYTIEKREKVRSLILTTCQPNRFTRRRRERRKKKSSLAGAFAANHVGLQQG